MAKTAVDLGDPLESRGGHALNSADDLLAQLAGEEVDRLLSEADGHPAAARNIDIPAAPASTPAPSPAAAAVAPSSTSAAPPAPPAPAAKKVDPNDAALDDLFNQLNAAEIPIPPAPAAKAKEKAAPISDAGLDDLFDQLNAAEISVPGATPAGAAPAAPVDPDAISRAMLGDLSAPAAKQAEAAPADALAPGESVEEALAQRAQALIEEARRQNEAEVTAGGAVQPASAADALAAEMEADDRAHSAALRRMKDAPAAPEPAAVPDEAGVAVIDEAAVEQAADRDDRAAELAEDRVPLVVRVLEWLNAPLSGLPDSVREALGKVALVTTFNSLAVLLYVLIFRR